MCIFIWDTYNITYPPKTFSQSKILLFVTKRLITFILCSTMIQVWTHGQENHKIDAIQHVEHVSVDLWWLSIYVIPIKLGIL